MSGLASQLLEFPPQEPLTPEQYHTEIRGFVDSLGKLDGNKAAKADSEQDFLQVLSPAVNSIPYLYILDLRFGHAFRTKNIGLAKSLYAQGLIFLQSFDGVQMRYAGQWFRELIVYLRQTAEATKALPQLVNPLLTAILRIDPTAGTLTSTHLLFLDLSLQTGQYQEALPLLQEVVHSLPAPKALYIESPVKCSLHTDSSQYITEDSEISEKLTTSDVHEYFLLGALIYIALRRWEDAQLYLELVLVSPASGSPSALQVEAYKKWTLVTCILKGGPADLPKAVSRGVLQNLHSCSKAYNSLVEIFKNDTSARLSAEVGAGQKLWSEDGNAGLVQEILDRQPRFYILDLQKTYSAIPLALVAQYLGAAIDLTHALIEGMVAERVLNATIDLNGAEPVLRFYSSQTAGPLAKTEKEYHKELLEQTKRTNAIAEYVKMGDRRLTLTKEYVEAVRKRSKNKDDGGALPGEIGGDLEPPDEDIMMDE